MGGIMFLKKDKNKETAKYLLSIAKKIENYRKDVLTKAQSDILFQTRTQIQKALTLPRAEAYKSFEDIDRSLKSIGGAVYPLTGLAENAEVFLFAAILALAIRTFFFQPFRIPTNSMWPTYAGMTFELGKGRRNIFEKMKRWMFLGASNFNAQANDSGTLQIPIAQSNDKTGPYGGILYYKVVNGRKFLGLLSCQEREYTFVVGGRHTTLRVPLEFAFDDVVLATLFPQEKSWKEVLDHRPSMRFKQLKINKDGHEDRINYFDTGIQKSMGEDIFNFDILSGDMLFVDRLSYHFSLPKVGDPFVFRTRNIKGLRYDDKYYIKRLVGSPGDVLQVENSTLYRNGAPIEGAEAFELNRKQVDQYPGYTNVGLLEQDYEVEIPENHYFAMGDNSPYSYDSRSWGFVPNREVIGRAIFILYPFTHRWGCSK
ncbi:MAG: signal peptidase I [Puniceicoccales bacterium]|jgi:signal peptidase I|nr:signal peptidase I [Puniceicoccales bacterium]